MVWSLLRVAAGAAMSVSLVLATPAAADNVVLETANGWRMNARVENGRYVRCFTGHAAGNKHVRLVSDGNRWWIGFTNTREVTGEGTISVDGTRFTRVFRNDGDYSYAPINDRVLGQLAAGRWLRFDVGGASAVASLNGSAYAIQRTRACVARIAEPGAGFSNRARAGETDEPEDTGPTPAATPPSAPSIAPGNPALGAGCPAPGAYASSGTAQAVTVTFDVRRSGDLTLYWLDGSGAPLALGPLVAGVQTVEGHVGDVFLARDASGACYGGAMQVGAGQTRFTVP